MQISTQMKTRHTLVMSSQSRFSSLPWSLGSSTTILTLFLKYTIRTFSSSMTRQWSWVRSWSSRMHTIVTSAVFVALRPRFFDAREQRCLVARTEDATKVALSKEPEHWRKFLHVAAQTSYEINHVVWCVLVSVAKTRTTNHVGCGTIFSGRNFGLFLDKHLWVVTCKSLIGLICFFRE